MKTKTEEIFKADKCFEFRLEWNVDKHWANVKAFQTLKYDNEDKYLEGFVKWDGCTELNQGQPHWCGPQQYKAHFALLKYIYHRAFKLMGREPEYPWD